MAKSIKVFLELDTSKFQKNLTQANTGVKGLTGSTSGLGAGLKTIAGLAASAFAFKGIVDTTARFEDLRTTLTSVVGSVDAGAEAFKNIQDFATRTQFGVEELTQTYIKLKTAGIEPTEKLLTTFTDTAAVTTDQLGSLEAITDLFARTVSGGLGLEELNRLADRGVPVFRILEEQLGLTRLEVAEFGKTADGANKITEALVKGLDAEFGGSTQARLENLSVGLSNFGIAATNAADTFGTGFAPALNEATVLLTDFITENDKMIADLGRLVGEGLKAVIDNLDIIIPALGAFAAGIAAVKTAQLISGIANATKALGAFNVVLRGNPVLLAVTAISAGVLLLITHWDEVKFAAQEFARLAQLGMVQLAKTLLEKLGAAIQAIIDLFMDLKAVGAAVAAGLAAAFKDPLNATTAFKDAFASTMKEVKDAQNRTIKPFQSTIDALAKKEEELTKVTERVGEEIKNLDSNTQDVTTSTKMASDAVESLTDNTNENFDAAVDLNKAFAEYVDRLSATEIQTKKTTEEREKEKLVMEAQKKAAEELGVTIKKLSEEQLKQIEDIVIAKYKEKQASEEAEKAAVKKEEEIQKALKKTADEIKRLMELTDEYYVEAVASAESYRQQLLIEGEQIVALTGLYGVERAVAEELFEFRAQAAEDIAKLQAAEQALREKGAEEEADQVAEKIANLQNALAEEEAAIAAAAEANAEYQRSFKFGWREAFADFSDKATNTAAQAGEVFTVMANGISDALFNFAMTGKLSFSELLDSMKATIARFLADRVTQKFLEFLDDAVFGNKSVGSSGGGGGGRSGGGSSGGGGGGGSSGGGIVDKVIDKVVDKGKDIIKGLFGFEDGGYIPGGKMAVVGEGGPELFMPSTSGTIIPNFAAGGMGGGGAQNIVYNISAVDAQSFKQLVARDPEFIYNVSQAGARRVPK